MVYQRGDRYRLFARPSFVPEGMERFAKITMTVDSILQTEGPCIEKERLRALVEQRVKPEFGIVLDSVEFNSAVNVGLRERAIERKGEEICMAGQGTQK